MDTLIRRMSDLALTVRCARCDTDSKQKIGPILAHRKFVCPSCSSLNDVDTAALEQKIGSAQKKRDEQRAAGTASAA